MRFEEIKQISAFEWEIGKHAQPGMLVPIRIFASQPMLMAALQDRSIEQAMNAAMLPGVLGWVCVLPDVHQGYGFPIGGVAALDAEEGVISPGAIGYDINCGVRLLASNLVYSEVKTHIETFTRALYQACPSGVGAKGVTRLGMADLKKICREGSTWALKNGYASEQDLLTTEDGGCMRGADEEAVSSRAIERGLGQVGSLGAGNHFIEVDVIDEIFDQAAADCMGLREGCVVLQLHSGSRGFGHQICTDFVRDFQTLGKKYNINLLDRELACAPLKSREGQRYLAAMRCAANYAFCNRQVLAYSARQVFEGLFKGHYLNNVYDLAHNIGKIETHKVAGKYRKVCVHRKGATRAYPPGHADVPAIYQSCGQPVLMPGSMGTSSWVMAGTAETMEKSFGSCSHGAGRVLSRTQAKKTIRGDQLRAELNAAGIFVQAGSMGGLAEEAPQAYKDIDQVIACVEGAGLGRRVARLSPVAVIKG